MTKITIQYKCISLMLIEHVKNTSCPNEFCKSMAHCSERRAHFIGKFSIELDAYWTV